MKAFSFFFHTYMYFYCLVHFLSLSFFSLSLSPPFPSLSLYRYRRIAGDKCVDGNDTFYSDVTVECPVLPPADMLISTDRIIVGVNYLLNFNLEQNSVSTTELS